MRAINYAYGNGKMSITQRQGVVTLLPKPDKDALLQKKWRPISLLNQDYKLLAKCIAARIKKYIGKIICNDQTGFMKGRYIGKNIFELMNIIDHADEDEIEALFMSIYFEKAFDLVEWDFIQKSLAFLNFGPTIRKWVKVMYNDISSCVTNNEWATTFFKLSRGMRHGCPLSPYLFILGVELLAIQIRHGTEIKGITYGDKEYKLFQFAEIKGLTYGDKEYKLFQFADDTGYYFI